MKRNYITSLGKVTIAASMFVFYTITGCANNGGLGLKEDKYGNEILEDVEGNSSQEEVKKTLITENEAGIKKLKAEHEKEVGDLKTDMDNMRKSQGSGNSGLQKNQVIEVVTLTLAEPMSVTDSLKGFVDEKIDKAKNKDKNLVYITSDDVFKYFVKCRKDLTDAGTPLDYSAFLNKIQEKDKTLGKSPAKDTDDIRLERSILKFILKMATTGIMGNIEVTKKFKKVIKWCSMINKHIEEMEEKKTKITSGI
jgi:hypothetical protein